MTRICFLTYLNRSGSTYLAKLLDGFSKIGVSLEAKLPDNLYNNKIDLIFSNHADDFVAGLYSDPKFSSWNLDINSLTEKIKKCKIPLNFTELLKTILAEYFKDQSLDVHIYKSHQYILYADEIRNQMPDVKFIFLLRDLRGIYNSQKNSLDSRTGKPMAPDPWITAANYNTVLEKIESYRNPDWLYILKYENLMKEKDKEINNLLKFLNVPAEKVERDKSYEEKIPPEQQHLHKNVGKDPIFERALKWKRGLSTGEIAVLQSIAGRRMLKFGYIPENIHFSLSLRTNLMFMFLRHQASEVLLKIKRRLFNNAQFKKIKALRNANR